MIQNYKARIDALQHIQDAIDELSGIVMKNPSVNSTILLLKTARENIINEMNEEIIFDLVE